MGNGDVLLLHYDKPVEGPGEPDAKLLYIGEGRKGRFYAEEQPFEGKTGFTHFHRFVAPTVEAGHGGPAGAEGYWLRHTAVTSFEMMGMTVAPGVDFMFMPTVPPKAGEGVVASTLPASVTEWKWSNEWPFTPPLPDHLWLDTGKGRLLFLHFNKPVNDPAAMLLYAGEAVRGRFCSEEQPFEGKTGFTHFHRFVAPTVDAGHGGPAGAEGYWLRHVAVASFEMMGMTVAPGVDFNFMPTVAPACQ